MKRVGSVTPRTQGCPERATGPRVFIDAGVAAAFAGRPPNKFTRLLELLTRCLPEAVTGTVTPHGFFVQAIATFDPTFDYARAIFPPPRVTVFARARAILLLLCHAAIGRLPLPNATTQRLRNAGAFHLGMRLPALTSGQRRFYYRAFELDRDAARREKFAWWSEIALKRATAPPFFASAPLALDVGPEHAIILTGLAGGIVVPQELRQAKERSGFKVVVVLLEIGPFLCPSITDADDYRRAELALRRLITVADLIIVPTPVMAAQLQSVMTALDLAAPPVATLTLPLGLSPVGARTAVADIFELSRTRRFALAVTTFKRRKNVAWIVAAWRRAAQIHGDALPHLVIAAAQIDETRAWLVTDDPSLKALVTIVPQPTDANLRWLFDHAAFVIQPPSHGGLGLAIADALAFGKRVICERRPSYAHLMQDNRVTALDLDMDQWVEAIGAAADPGISSETDAASAPKAHLPETSRKGLCDVAKDLDELITGLHSAPK